MNMAKTQKTCAAQFSLMREIQAYEEAEFYTTKVTRAKEELGKVTPFSTLQCFQGPWMPEIKFQKPSFNYANSEGTCAYFPSFPSFHDIQFMMEPFNYDTKTNAPHFKFYVIFDCKITTKMQLEKIKLENTKAPTKEAQVQSDFNQLAQILVGNAEKAMNTRNTDIQKANSD